MAIRCFARRHLVAARHPLPALALGADCGGGGGSRQACVPSAYTQQRHASTSSQIAKQKGTATASARPGGAASSSSIHIGQREVKRFVRPPALDFFSIRTPDADEVEAGTNDAEAAEAYATNALRPLVRDLLNELRNQSPAPNAQQVWQLYTAIMDGNELDFAQQEPSSRVGEQSSLSSQGSFLPAYMHVRVLSVVAQAQSSRRSARTSTESSQFNDVSHYLHQIGIIFSNLRNLDPERLPTKKHYNKAMLPLAEAGSMGGLLRLWTTMNAGSLSSDDPLSVDASDDGAPGLPKPKFWEEGQGTGARPDLVTYELMMQGIAKNLEQCISREYAKDRVRDLVPSHTGLRNERRRILSEKYADDTELYTGEPEARNLRVNANVRNTLNLATERTVALLNDMMAKGVRMRKVLMDMALSVMQMTGNTAGLKMVMRTAFGVDLDNLDADAVMLGLQPSQRDFCKPDVRSLNILVTALGEQTSISKMVAAYETLSKPLPRSEAKMEAIEAGEYVAGLDFRGLFKWRRQKPTTSDAEQQVDDTTATAAVETSPSVSESTTTTTTPDWPPQYAILPSRTTMETMIRSACYPPMPERLLLQAYMSLTPAQLAERAKEYEQRRSGQYASVALYLIDETLMLQRAETMRLAQGLGIQADGVDVDQIVEEIEAMDEEGHTGLPPREDDGYLDEYTTRLHIIAGDAKRAFLMRKSLSTIECRLDAASASEEELKAEQAKVARQQATAHAFLQRHDRRGADASSDLRLVDELTAPSASPFAPQLCIPRIELSVRALRPIFSLAGVSRNQSLLRRMGARIRRAMALHIVEMRILALALAHWYAHVQRHIEATRSDAATSSSVLERQTMLELVLALNDRHERASEQVDRLAHEYQHRVRDRLHAFFNRRQAFRQYQWRQLQQQELEDDTNEDDTRKSASELRAERKAIRNAEAAAAASVEALRLQRA